MGLSRNSSLFCHYQYSSFFQHCNKPAFEIHDWINHARHRYTGLPLLEKEGKKGYYVKPVQAKGDVK